MTVEIPKPLARGGPWNTFEGYRGVMVADALGKVYHRWLRQLVQPFLTRYLDVCARLQGYCTHLSGKQTRDGSHTTSNIRFLKLSLLLQRCQKATLISPRSSSSTT
eukprot:TRINITY_DN58652_c0_g1_i2.p2 TRINITY_DN58652_c0_g1~~TRINITY_DN58652_c0_g1_i2.p2  ORF type:complete len:106 (+),score=6.02 TRINITY_DN58652_c0_g1_i2:31-348(+)